MRGNRGRERGEGHIEGNKTRMEGEEGEKGMMKKRKEVE